MARERENRGNKIIMKKKNDDVRKVMKAEVKVGRI